MVSRVLPSQDYGDRFIFLITQWKFRRHTTICKKSIQNKNKTKIIMYLLFSYLGTWILRDWMVHFFPSTITERASNQATVGKPGFSHSYYKARYEHNQQNHSHHIRRNGTSSYFMGFTGIQALLYCSYIFTQHNRKSLQLTDQVELWHNERATC